MKIKFKQWDCTLKIARYENDRIALILNGIFDGSRIAVATVNMPDVSALEDEIFIKDYSENEGMLKALMDAGVVSNPIDYISSGFVQIPRVKLLIKVGDLK